MNVYVETNFILELVLRQEQHSSCAQILLAGERSTIHLFIPAFSLLEASISLATRAKERNIFQATFSRAMRELGHNSDYQEQLTQIDQLSPLLIKSNQEEAQRLYDYQARLLKSAAILPLTPEVIEHASIYIKSGNFSPQDAVVYASVIRDLLEVRPPQSCFLNRNSKDFDNPDVISELNSLNCKSIFSFDSGYSYIQAQTKA